MSDDYLGRLKALYWSAVSLGLAPFDLAGWQQAEKWIAEPTKHEAVIKRLRQAGVRIPQLEKPFNLYPLVVSSKRKRLGVAVVTGMDSAMFGFGQRLIQTVKAIHDCEVWVCDLGLSDQERSVLLSLGAFVWKPKSYLVDRSVEMWQTWNKAAWIFECPTALDGRLWIDADAFVLRDIEPLADEVLRGGRVVTRCYCAMYGDPNRWREITLNHSELYDLELVAKRWRPEDDVRVNAGVCGFRKGDGLLEQWVSITRKAGVDRSYRELFAWWDQGALVLAMEKMGIGSELVLLDRKWNDTSTRWRCGGDFESAVRRSESRVIHLAGRPKPNPASLSFEPIKHPPCRVYVIGHRDEQLASVGNRPWLTKVDLRSGSCHPELAESNAWLLNLNPSEAYVGFASASWNTKYSTSSIDACLDRLDYRPDVVWAASVAPPDFQQVKRAVHCDSEWVGLLCEDVTGLKAKGVSLWSNNFVCHRDIFLRLREFMRRTIPALMERMQPNHPGHDCPDPSRKFAYALEEVAMLWWSNQTNLNFRQI